MKLKTLVVTGALALALAAAPAAAKTFRYAFQGDLNALDPYTLNESFTLGALGNVMEGLTKRDKDLKIIPGLAERWEIVDPLKWRFYLRKGVKFHDGEDFTADDVVFSTERMRSPGSQIKTRAPADMKAVKVDDYTVDFVLTSPNPILHCRMGHLVHVLQEVGGGERGDAGAGSLGDLAQSVRAQGQRHRARS